MAGKKQFKVQGYAIVTPFQDYVKQKTDWKLNNRGARILEEIKTLFLAMADVPDPQLIGRTKQQQVLMIAWAVVFEVAETELIN